MVLPVALEHIPLVLRGQIIRALAKEPGIERLTEVFCEDMVDQAAYGIGLKMRVPGRHLPEVRYPADWWQAFKDRWFPAWAKERWPVRYVRYDLMALYPEIKLPQSCGPSVLRVARQTVLKGGAVGPDEQVWIHREAEPDVRN